MTVMSHPFIGCVMTTEQQQRFIKHLSKNHEEWQVKHAARISCFS
ncbi:MAG: hypothetical protein AABY79_12545 [Nitrospirota bacterium]